MNLQQYGYDLNELIDSIDDFGYDSIKQEDTIDKHAEYNQIEIESERRHRRHYFIITCIIIAGLFVFYAVSIEYKDIFADFFHLSKHYEVYNTAFHLILVLMLEITALYFFEYVSNVPGYEIMEYDILHEKSLD